MNDFAFLDALNVKIETEINEEENGEEEVVIKEDPQENDLVSGSKVTLLKWLLTYFFHLYFIEIKFCISLSKQKIIIYSPVYPTWYIFHHFVCAF